MSSLDILSNKLSYSITKVQFSDWKFSSSSLPYDFYLSISKKNSTPSYISQRELANIFFLWENSLKMIYTPQSYINQIIVNEYIELFNKILETWEGEFDPIILSYKNYNNYYSFYINNWNHKTLALTLFKDIVNKKYEKLKNNQDKLNIYLFKFHNFISKIKFTILNEEDSRHMFKLEEIRTSSSLEEITTCWNREIIENIKRKYNKELELDLTTI